MPHPHPYYTIRQLEELYRESGKLCGLVEALTRQLLEHLPEVRHQLEAISGEAHNQAVEDGVVFGITELRAKACRAAVAVLANRTIG